MTTWTDPGGLPRHRSGRHGVRGRRSSGTAVRGGLAALALVVAAGVGFGGGVLATGGGDTRTAAAAAALPSPAPARLPAAAPELPSRPTMMGQITGVRSGDLVEVDVAGTTVGVRVLGVDAPQPAAPGRAAECGSAEATAFAREMLQGRTVTLVPDPTLPETDAQGMRMSYVVMRSQFSYTDAALMAGMVRTDTSMPLTYDEVFAGEQRRAADDEEGLWGVCLPTTTG